ncbi:hypothetical protein E0K83_05950 [Gramella sp. BOM4]|nr:hypothetical protein [Christiangramia bathymodioli]
MRTRIMILSILVLITGSCSSQDYEEVEKIQYEMYTRGSSTTIDISKEEIEVISTGLNADQSSMKLKEEEWEGLVETMKVLDIEKLKDLEVSSDLRASDAAPHAVLKLHKNDTVYESNTFDHGNPPQSIRPLVQAILRLSENVE